LDDEHLRQHGADPYAVEYRVGEESLENVALAVNLTRVDLVEKCHHDECVEDDSEMLCWLRTEFGSATGWYVQHFVAGKQ